MAPRTFSTCAQQRRYTFARKRATPFTDSRRRRFLVDMVPGLVLANHVHLSKVARTALAEERKPRRWPRPWPPRGYTACCTVHLPKVSAEELLLVVPWRWPHRERPLLLLVRLRAGQRGRMGRWLVQAYPRRWGVEDGTRGIQQPFALESFWVRSWRSIRRLLWLVGWAFGWLNLWGEERFARLREALLRHRWRLPKGVTYLFDGIAQMLHELLHPRPKLPLGPG